MAALDMAHSPKACDEHGLAVDRFAAGSTTLGPPSAAVDDARGFDADAARSTHGLSSSLASSADDDCSASGDSTPLESLADNDAAAWSSWVTSLPSGTNTPGHLTKRLREARRAFRAAISSAHHAPAAFHRPVSRSLKSSASDDRTSLESFAAAWSSWLGMAHSPKVCDEHGLAVDRFAAGSTTLGPPSAAVDDARGFDADAARSTHGLSSSLASSADDDCSASGDSTPLESLADNDAAAWSSWVTSLPSGTNTPGHLTKRLREARRAFRVAISSAPHAPAAFHRPVSRSRQSELYVRSRELCVGRLSRCHTRIFPPVHRGGTLVLPTSRSPVTYDDDR